MDKGFLLSYAGQCFISKEPFPHIPLFGVEETGNTLSFCGFYRINPENVGQYTGLKDKNEKQIFEGDILRVCLNPEICIGTVEYDERICGFIVKFNNNRCVTFMDIYIGKSKAEGRIWIEVIGNIYDSPELLEEGSA